MNRFAIPVLVLEVTSLLFSFECLLSCELLFSRSKKLIEESESHLKDIEKILEVGIMNFHKCVSRTKDLTFVDREDFRFTEMLTAN